MERTLPVNFLSIRDALLTDALEYVANLKGKKQDLALFDYLAGAVKALYRTGDLDTEVPGWLFVLGVRGGTRVEEARRMLNEIKDYATAVSAESQAPSDDASEKVPAANKLPKQ